MSNRRTKRTKTRRLFRLRNAAFPSSLYRNNPVTAASVQVLDAENFPLPLDVQAMLEQWSELSRRHPVRGLIMEARFVLEVLEAAMEKGTLNRIRAEDWKGLHAIFENLDLQLRRCQGCPVLADRKKES